MLDVNSAAFYRVLPIKQLEKTVIGGSAISLELIVFGLCENTEICPLRKTSARLNGSGKTELEGSVESGKLGPIVQLCSEVYK